MRALFVAAPLPGHVIPLVPLATAMRHAGHKVLFATGGDALSVRDSGFTVTDVAPGFTFRPVVRRVMMRHPLVARAELAGNGGNRGAPLIFGAINDRIVDEVVAVARSFGPDLVLYDSAAPAGAVAAATFGVPAVLHGIGLFDDAEQTRVISAGMTKAPGSFGPAARPPYAASVTIAPPSVVGPHPGWPMRYVIHGQGSLPDWLATRAGRPRVLVTRSTVGDPGGGGLMRAVVAAAPEVDAEFVLICPGRRITRRLPANVRTVGWIPFSAALATSSAIVHHGGTGTALGALAAGLPQLVVPGLADRRYNADVVSARGAGLAMRPGQITAEHLTRLVTDPAIAAAAGEVRDEIAAMPAPAALVDSLAALAGTTHSTKDRSWHTAC